MHKRTIKLIKDILLDKEKMIDDILILFISGLHGIGKSYCIEKALELLNSQDG